MANTRSAAARKQRGPLVASPTIQERKQQVVRTAIWDAATDLFFEKGYDETTVEDIAEKAGVSRRSFFRYFSSKADLMGHGIVGYAAYLSDAIDGFPPEDSLAEIFRKTVLQAAQECAAHPRTRKIMEIAAKYPAAREAHHSRTPELQVRVTEAYARRVAKHSKEDLSPAIIAGLTLSVLSLIFQSWFEQRDKDISDVVNQALSTLGRLNPSDREAA
jgi:AcrR family transcriptional regulator